MIDPIHLTEEERQAYDTLVAIRQGNKLLLSLAEMVEKLEHPTDFTAQFNSIIEAIGNIPKPDDSNVIKKLDQLRASLESNTASIKNLAKTIKNKKGVSMDETNRLLGELLQQMKNPPKITVKLK